MLDAHTHLQLAERLHALLSHAAGRLAVGLTPAPHRSIVTYFSLYIRRAHGMEKIADLHERSKCTRPQLADLSSTIAHRLSRRRSSAVKCGELGSP